MPFGAVFEEHKEAGNGFFFCPLFYYRTEIIENSFYFTFLKTVEEIAKLEYHFKR